jgi:glycosyltransferase involved in cell wall biosynthesis
MQFPVKTISVAITTYNRFELTCLAIDSALHNARVNDLLVLDDCSTDGSYERIKEKYKYNDKVRVVKQFANRGMMQNKADAVFLAKNDWVLLLDSDNRLDEGFIEAFFALRSHKPNVFYCPQKAKPAFDFTQFLGIEINATNVAGLVDAPFFGVLINTANYIVNKQTYSTNYVYNPKIKGCDTAWLFYNHLLNGGAIQVVQGMEYSHLVHEGSTWMQDAAYNMQSAKEIDNLLKQLK